MLAKAALEDKLIFVDIYADWCGPCKAMESQVFTASIVSEYFNENFISVKWLEKKPAIKKRLDSLRIQSLPTYLFLHENGEIVHRINGFQSAKKLRQEADFALKQNRNWIPLKTLNERYESGNYDAQLLAQLLNRLYAVSGPQPGILDDYLKVLPKSLLHLESNLILIAQHIKSIQSESFQVLKETLSSFFEFTDVQQKAVLEAIGRAKLETFKLAVDSDDEDLFNELMEAVYETSYSRQAAMQEERQFRYDFAKLTRNFKFFAIIAYAEAPIILEQDFAKLDAEKQDYLQTAPEASALDLANVIGSSKKAAASQLHEFAYGFLQMTDDKDQLRNALKWSASSISFHDRPEYWLTYAKLLFALERKNDAKKAVRKSKKLLKKMGGDTKQWDFSLEIDE